MVSVNKTSFDSIYVAKIPSFILGIFALVSIVSSSLSWHFQSIENREFLAPPRGIEHFTFGYAELSADILWIRTIQDFDYCEKQSSERVCINNSWLFKMLDAITDLAPQFRIAYAAGGLALTVIISDYDGATKIFEKGVKEFPNDWPLSYRAAYHYLYEVKDNKRAAELLTQAGKNGAPPWVFSLAGRLYSDAGSAELAEKLLEEMIETNQDPTIIKRLQEKIDSIKKAQ